MTVEEVKTMPLARKLQIMETIWEEFRERLEKSDLPPRLQDLLDQRRARARAGSSLILDWDTVKSSIGRP